MTTKTCKLLLWGRDSRKSGEECYYFIFDAAPTDELQQDELRTLRVEVLAPSRMFEGDRWQGLTRRESLAQVFAFVRDRLSHSEFPSSEKLVLKLGSGREGDRFKAGPPYPSESIHPREAIETVSRRTPHLRRGGGRRTA